MTLMQAPGSRPGQICVLMLIFTVLLQAFGMAVFYVYLNKELKQVSTVQTLPDRRSQHQLAGCLCWLLCEDFTEQEKPLFLCPAPGTLTANAYHC